MKPPSERTRPPAFARPLPRPGQPCAARGDAQPAPRPRRDFGAAALLPARGQRPADARRLWPSGPDRAGRLRTLSEHFLAETSLPCYLTSHDEDQTPGVSDDGGENRGKRREGAGGHGVSLQAFEKVRSGKENERKRKELGLFSQHPRAPFRVCVRSCTFRKGRAAGGRRPNNCTDSFLRAKRECRRKTPLNLLGLGRLGGYKVTDFA